MKKQVLVSILLTLSATSAFANTVKMDLNTTNERECDAAVATVSHALANYSVSVSKEQNMILIPVSNSYGMPRFQPGDCNAVLSSTGSQQLTLSTVKTHGHCGADQLNNPAFAGAVYLNSYHAFGNCVIDALYLK